MATQTGRGGGGRDVNNGKAQAGRSGARDNAMGGGRDRAIDRGNVRGAGGYMSPTGRLAQRADVRAATRGTATDAQANAAARSWADRVSDYRDTYNTPMEKFGNFAASMLGFNEMRPSFDPTLQNTQNRANWGFDPAGTIGSIAGMAAGIPFGGGLLFDQISKYSGRPLEIALGPSVFGGPAAVPGQVQTAAGLGGSAGKALSNPPFTGRVGTNRDPNSTSSLGSSLLNQNPASPLATTVPPPQHPGMMAGYQPGKWLGIGPGSLPSYGAAVPGYGYFR